MGVALAKWCESIVCKHGAKASSRSTAYRASTRSCAEPWGASSPARRLGGLPGRAHGLGPGWGRTGRWHGPRPPSVVVEVAVLASAVIPLAACFVSPVVFILLVVLMSRHLVGFRWRLSRLW